MTAQYYAGRWLVILVIQLTMATSILAVAMYGLRVDQERLPLHLLRLVHTVGLSVFLYRGHNWSRWVAGVLYSLGGLESLLVGVVALPAVSLLLFSLVLGLVQLFAAFVLLGVPAVSTYFRIGPRWTTSRNQIDQPQHLGWTRSPLHDLKRYDWIDAGSIAPAVALGWSCTAQQPGDAGLLRLGMSLLAAATFYGPIVFLGQALLRRRNWSLRLGELMWLGQGLLWGALQFVLNFGILVLPALFLFGYVQVLVCLLAFAYLLITVCTPRMRRDDLSLRWSEWCGALICLVTSLAYLTTFFVALGNTQPL